MELFASSLLLSFLPLVNLCIRFNLSSFVVKFILSYEIIYSHMHIVLQ